MSDDSRKIEFDGVLRRHEHHTPWWSGAVRAVERLIKSLPSHRDTQTGRRNAQQIRLLLLVIGLLTLVFGGRWYFIVIGLVAMASAVVIPLSEVHRRSLQFRLKKLRTGQTREVKQTVRIVCDERRVEIRDEKLIRAVRIDRSEHHIELGRLSGGSCITLRPSVRKKSKPIWLCSTSDDWLPDESSEVRTTDVDMVVEVSQDDLQDLYDVLNDDHA